MIVKLRLLFPLFLGLELRNLTKRSLATETLPLFSGFSRVGGDKELGRIDSLAPLVHSSLP